MIPNELRVGDVVEGFRVIRRLYAGSMAVIYEVSGADLPGPAVMKVPRMGQGESPANIVSFEVERMILSALYPGPVPTVYAVGDLERAPYIVMEKIPGPPLSSMAEKLPLPVAEVCTLGAAIAGSAHRLHCQEVVHLDLKPSNILLREDGTAVLVDLGLAHHAHYPDLLAEQYQRPLGSAPYIAPEQVLGVRNDARSDIFAIGVILYQFATGRLPFGSPSGSAALRKRLRKKPAPPRLIRSDIPAALQEVILRCLEVDPERRYGAANQLALDLTHLEEVVVTDRGATTAPAAWRQRVRHWLFGFGFEPASLLTPTPAVRRAPIILVAVAPDHDDELNRSAMRAAAAHLAHAIPTARLAFVSVVRTPPVLGVSDEARSGPREHRRQLVELRHWAHAVAVDAGRKTCHVLESNDPVGAIVSYAEANGVDHILLGAPSPTLVRQSNAERIVAAAKCSVTVVRSSSRVSVNSEGSNEGERREARRGPN